MRDNKETMDKIISLLAERGYPLWDARRLLLDTIKEMERTAVITSRTPERS